eukprot:g1103.t1
MRLWPIPRSTQRRDQQSFDEVQHKLNAGAVTFAHNMVLRSIAQMCTDAGAQTNVEEAVMGSTQHRIDIHAAWGERSILIDVRVVGSGTTAESASTRVSSAVEAGFAPQKAEIRKETNAFYQLAASRLGDGAIIMPFAFERQCRLGKNALGLIEFCVGKRVNASLDIIDSIEFRCRKSGKGYDVFKELYRVWDGRKEACGRQLKLLFRELIYLSIMGSISICLFLPAILPFSRLICRQGLTILTRK